jgi:hypothetical protein
MVDLSPASRRRMMTPSGVQTAAYQWGAPRPPGPTQELIPVGRGLIPVAGERASAQNPSLEALPIALPKLDSPLVQSPAGPLAIPWQYLMINLFRLAQPTGAVPGTYGGITVNAHGQIVATQSSGASIDSPNLTGHPTTVTPPANDNSTAIANTEWVQAWVDSQNFIMSSRTITLTGDAAGAGQFGTVPNTVVGLRGRPISAAAPATGQGLVWNGSAWTPTAVVPEAPLDGQRYVRQNGAWVVIVSP